MPFHFAGRGRANLLTNPALDPISKMPEFKVCAVRIEPVQAAPVPVKAVPVKAVQVKAVQVEGVPA
jgi:predicted molibdopterin-dependent oxidoreductase YjgC